jgi:CMP/dCMP kinase
VVAGAGSEAIHVTVIAIDGPAGAGKSSVARAVASALGFRYLDTGAMYRSMAVAMLDRGIDPSDQGSVEALAPSVAAGLDLDVEGFGVDHTRLRAAGVGTAASVVARYPGVRNALATRQRQVAREADVVMEGRDIGTVVAPKAEVKLYLTASPPVRARRRREQLDLPDDGATIQAIEEALVKRDHADSVRPDSPLKPASDAVILDSSDRTLAQVVSDVLEVIHARLGRQ